MVSVTLAFSGSASPVYRSFLTWHKTHFNLSKYHSDFYVFTHPGYHDPVGK